jgi:hypothetical protein
MVNVTFIQDLLWCANSPLVLWVAWGMYRRGLVPQFRIFFWYLLLVSISGPLEMAVYARWGFNSWPYFSVYWVVEFFAKVTVFLVLYGVIRNVMTSGSLSLSRWQSSGIFAALSVTSVLCVLLMKRDPMFMQAVLIPNNVLNLLQVEVVLGLVVVSRFFGFYWEDLTFGIAAGFGIIGGLDLTASYLLNHVGKMALSGAQLVISSDFLIAIILWLFYVGRQPHGASAPLPSSELLQFSTPVGDLLK